MSTTFAPQPHDEWPMIALRKAVKAWHPRLQQAEVTFAVLLADNETESPLKNKGHKVLACIKIIPYEYRVCGMPDVMLKIDKREWESLEEDSQFALLDHELCHVDLRKYKERLPDDEDGPDFPYTRKLATFERDDFGRPKLRAVHGDWMGGDGFRVVIERHGDAAIELINARRVAEAAESYNPDPEIRHR